jgi:hypothetical protein
MEARLEKTLVGLLRSTDAERARVTRLRDTSAVEVVLSSRASILFPTDDAAEATEILDRARRLARPGEPPHSA